MPFRMPLAGESEIPSPDSVLSHCYGALLPMFDTKEATELRHLCREFKTTVADFPWEDDQTVIKGSVAAWRTCFPRARWANVKEYEWALGEDGRRTPMVDADFVHFVGLRRLDMSECRSVTDAAFEHLKGIHTLNMSSCNSRTITDAAFVHLKGIHTLDMSFCNQSAITDATFAHLKGIHSLTMVFCYGLIITDAAFAHLKGIHTLNLHGCTQPTITDAAFVHLTGIHSLCLIGCTQLTNAVFPHIKGVKRLNISECPQLTITDDSLKGIEWLCMGGHPLAHVEQARSFGFNVVTAGDYFE